MTALTLQARPSGGLMYPRPPKIEVVQSIPPGGAIGDVLTKATAADYDAGWAAPSGGGGGGGSVPAWVTLHPDTPPGSPTLFGGVAYDKEFTILGAHGGTVVGSPATAPTIVAGLLKVFGGTSSTADLKGVEWACPPGGVFTMTAKVIRKIYGATYWVGGPFLRVGTSGSGNLNLAYSAVGANQYVSGFIGSGRYTSPTARSSISSEPGWPTWQAIYVRLVVNASNVLHQHSYSGHPTSFATTITETLATALGAAPGRFGFGMDTFNGSFAGEIYCQWIRFT